MEPMVQYMKVPLNRIKILHDQIAKFKDVGTF